MNPLLDGLKLPGRIFVLPSKGMFYKNGELADTVKDGEIHVRPMSALDEIDMKNADQLFSGAAIETVFKKCVDGVNKPSELLAKDVDAIMIFLRAVTYGQFYEFIATHDCNIPQNLILPKDVQPTEEQQEQIKEYFSNYRKQHSYNADVEAIINGIKFIDPTMMEADYTLNLPEYNQVVKLHPNKYEHVINLIKDNQNKKELSVTEKQNNLINMLLGVIESVNGITDAAMIEEWARKIPPTTVNRIADKIDSIEDWGASLTWKCKCKDCGEMFDVDIPINPISFFIE